jgi:hypothetical protein
MTAEVKQHKLRAVYGDGRYRVEITAEGLLGPVTVQIWTTGTGTTRRIERPMA